MKPATCGAGVAMLVVPAVRVLDMVYATRITLEDLARRYGQQPLEWPAHVVEQLKERNAAIHAARGQACHRDVAQGMASRPNRAASPSIEPSWQTAPFEFRERHHPHARQARHMRKHS